MSCCLSYRERYHSDCVGKPLCSSSWTRIDHVSAARVAVTLITGLEVVDDLRLHRALMCIDVHCLQLIAFGQGWKHIRKGWTLLQWLTICFDLSKDGAISDYCSSTLKPTETELVALLSLSATGTKCFCVCGLSFGVEHSALERATLERPAKTNEQLMSPQLRRRCCVGIQSSGCKCGGGAAVGSNCILAQAGMQMGRHASSGMFTGSSVGGRFSWK